jgi:hypothetical protein
MGPNETQRRVNKEQWHAEDNNKTPDHPGPSVNERPVGRVFVRAPEPLALSKNEPARDTGEPNWPAEQPPPSLLLGSLDKTRRTAKNNGRRESSWRKVRKVIHQPKRQVHFSGRANWMR